MSQECGVPKGVWFQTMLFAGVSHSPWFLPLQVGVETSKIVPWSSPWLFTAGEGWCEHRRHYTSTGWPFSPNPDESKKNSVLTGPPPHSRLRTSPFSQKSNFSQLFKLLIWSEHCLSSVTQTQGCTEMKLSLTWWICTTLHPELKQLTEMNNKYIDFWGEKGLS